MAVSDNSFVCEESSVTEKSFVDEAERVSEKSAVESITSDFGKKEDPVISSVESIRLDELHEAEALYVLDSVKLVDRVNA
jgi:hypothetical protein